ncbi:ribosome recycling factor [Candidatus Marinamargulisbacteria bacterium SCGC AG-414-C22]|nr:ribosome recycling factor [Candidatus Marinamargulisbacteria bacterium SCGC AG-414-C22]
MDNIDQRMQKSIDDLKRKLATLRTNRANPDMLQHVVVDYYGSQVPLQQLASISVPESTQLLLNIFDSNATKDIEKALMTSKLDLNPIIDGSVIRINLPELTEDRRKDLVKVMKQIAEESRIALRNIRRDALDFYKQQEKEKEITEDILKHHTTQVQQTTDSFSKKIDDLITQKETEILTI